MNDVSVSLTCDQDQVHVARLNLDGSIEAEKCVNRAAYFQLSSEPLLTPAQTHEEGIYRITYDSAGNLITATTEVVYDAAVVRELHNVEAFLSVNIGLLAAVLVQLVLRRR